MSSMVSLGAMAAYFLRLGCIGFGGPPAHIALMRRDLVEQRNWVQPAQFESDLAKANLIPGPTSTELAIYIGYRMHGAAGAIVGGSMFILPAFIFVLLLAIAYRAGSGVSWIDALLYAIKPAALALMISGVIQLGRPITTDWRQIAIFAAALLTLIVAPTIDVLLVFVVAGLALLMLRHALPSGAQAIAFVPAIAAAATTVSALTILLTFLRIGVAIYGGGFALATFLQQDVVERLGWISARELLDAIAIGQSTPGPVFTTATFIGYLVGGIPGAIAATIGIFTPAFVFVLLENALLGRVTNQPAFKLFLQGVNAAVVASLVVSIGQLGSSALPDAFTLMVCVVAFVALTWKKIDAHWIVGAALLIGIGRLAFGI
jgi:chromate transporter